MAPKKRIAVEDGYGNSTPDLGDAFLALGVELETDPNVRKADGLDFCLIYGPPQYAEHVPHNLPYAVYTMWESDKPPLEWKEYLENAVFVANPSEWGCRIFEERYGLEKVHHIPLAYDSDVFQYQGEPGGRKDKFTFISYNSGFAAVRKGFLETVEAFKIAFEPDDPVKLIIKSSRPDIYGDLQKIAWEDMKREGDKTWDNMEYVVQRMSREMLAELVRSSDCFVFPSRGEGFGMTPVEAMSMGMPCVISSWGGMSEYFDEDIHYGFKGALKDAEYDRDGDDFGVWTVADTQDLARAMREVYQNQDEARARGKKGVAIATRYSYEKTAQSFIDLINTHVNR